MKIKKSWKISPQYGMQYIILNYFGHIIQTIILTWSKKTLGIEAKYFGTVDDVLGCGADD